ncbi:MAG: hypothetical protein U1E23_06765 [Reyranellaceae bacterium]
MAPPDSDSLAEGRLFVEVQVSSWPPEVTQTLLSKRDARQALTVRARPSGRLRVELQREGYEPLVVRTQHLRLRAPGLLRLAVAWRGDEAVVAAGGQVIGSSSDFDPAGVAAPQLVQPEMVREMVQETAAPLDHVGNERARTERRRRVESLLSEIEGDASHATAWFAALAESVAIARDLIELVRQGRRHHVPGVADTLVRLIVGEAPLLQVCAGVLDAPLALFVSPSPSAEAVAGGVLGGAFDVALQRSPYHALAVDLDVWLAHEHAWRKDRRVPIAALLVAIEAALSVPRAGHLDSESDRTLRSLFGEPAAAVALCGFVSTVCTLAESLLAARVQRPAANESRS